MIFMLLFAILSQNNIKENLMLLSRLLIVLFLVAPFTSSYASIKLYVSNIGLE